MLVEPLQLPGVEAPAAPCFQVHGAQSAGRARTERFIQRVYAEHYGAVIRHWKPTLVSLELGGLVMAAAGYRSAAEPLFLEHYLTQPVEQAIAAQAGVAVRRDEIAEVGHFASAQPGMGRRLMSHLGRQLAAAGFQWVVSTATRDLRLIFERVRIRPLALGAADPAVLGAAAADWGTYYQQAPLVLAGEIRANLARFAPLP